MSPLDLTILTGGLLVAGFAKGAAAMGLPLIATPILAGVFGPRLAVVIVTVPIFAANTILILQDWKRLRELRHLGVLVLLGIAGTAVGSQLLAQLDQRTFALLITAMVAVFLLRGDRLLGDDPTVGRGRVIGPFIALAGGLLQGTTSIASPLVGSYFHALRLQPRDFVLSLAVLFEFNSVTQIVSYGLAGLYTPQAVAYGIAGLVPALVGLAAGIALRGRLDPRRFRQGIVVLIVVSAVNLLRTTFFP